MSHSKELSLENKNSKDVMLYTARGEKIEFIWPDFKTSFPIDKSKVYTRALVDKCAEDCYAHSNFKTVTFERYYHTGTFAAALYPQCEDKERMEVLIKLMMFFFIIDDHTEYEWGDVGRINEKAIVIWNLCSSSFDKLLGDDVSMLDWKPYITGFYTCFDRIFASFNRVQQERCAKYWQDYCRGNIDESLWYQKKHFESVEEVVAVRMKTVGAYPVFQLIEYSENIYITEEEWQDPIFLKLIKVGVELLFLVNEFYSFRKELVECSEHFETCRNLIALFVTLEGMSLQVAVDRLMDMIRESEKKIWDLENEYYATHDVSEAMNHYINSFNLVCGGNWIAHVGLDRYTNFDPETEAKIIKGRFVYDKQITLVHDTEPEQSLANYFTLR